MISHLVSTTYCTVYMLWFDFILGLIYIFFFLYTHYHTLPYTKTKENKNWTTTYIGVDLTQDKENQIHFIIFHFSGPWYHCICIGSESWGIQFVLTLWLLHCRQCSVLDRSLLDYFLPCLWLLQSQNTGCLAKGVFTGELNTTILSQ